MTTKKVLIPIDGSDFSLQILEHVKQFFDPKVSELVLLEVAQEPEMVELRPFPDEDLSVYLDEAEYTRRGQISEGLEPLAQTLRNEGFSARVEVRFGEPISAIEDFINNEGIDLVAMTTHGRTGLSRVLWGSVAQHVLHHCTVPILLYRSLVHEPVPA
jgi:nucleotide-binding universal stress UspA family protein